MATEAERITRLEQAFVALTDLLQKMDARADRHDDSIERHELWLDQMRAAEINTDARLAALTDAQIQTEAALTRLADAQARTDERLNALMDRLA
jgi:hypothetical protein